MLGSVFEVCGTLLSSKARGEQPVEHKHRICRFAGGPFGFMRAVPAPDRLPKIQIGGSEFFCVPGGAGKAHGFTGSR